MPCAGESQRHGRHGVPPGVSDAAMSIPTRRRGPTVPKALLKSPALRQIQGLSPFVTHIDRAVCELAHTQSRICRFVSIRPASPQVDSVGVPPFGGETWKRRAAARA